MEVILFLLWFLPTLLAIMCGVVYLPARVEWNDTFKRGALIARANMGSKKSKKALAQEKLALNPRPEGDNNAVAVAEWTAKFTGQELVLLVEDDHRIVKSWNELKQTEYSPQPEVRWFWECACGEKESRKTKDAAKQSARRHMILYQGRNKDLVKDQGWLKL